MQRLHRLTHYPFSPVLLICASLLSACSSTAPAQRQQYDFGPFNTISLPNTKMQIALAEIQVPAALDSNAMLYRLQYDNAQLKSYAQARWSMPPAQLVAQRIKLVLNARRCGHQHR
jgi:cholesterol transport system auxiliary component